MMHQLFLTGFKPLQLNPLFFGSEKCSPEHNYSGFRDHYILHLIYKGEGTFHLKGKRWELGPGDGFLIPPGEKNRYIASSNNPWHYVWVAWEDPTGEMQKSFSFTPNKPCIHILNSFSVDLLSILQSDKPNLDKQNRSSVWFSSLMLHLQEKYPGKNITNSKKYKEEGKAIYEKKMQDFIHGNYTSRINAVDVAKHINLERSYASRIFKNAFNTGIYEYIQGFRFRKACDLLMTDYSVKEVCFSCGYSDYGNFLKTFKKMSGLSPTEYRKGIK